MTSSRGLFPLPAGLYATARFSDRSGARPEFVSGAASAVVDSDGGICFHRGFGVWQSAALFERLFDIVIRRKGNAGGGVLADPLGVQALGGSNRLWRFLRFSHHHGASGSGQLEQDAFCVKVPVTQRFLGLTSKPKPESKLST